MNQWFMHHFIGLVDIAHIQQHDIILFQQKAAQA